MKPLASGLQLIDVVSSASGGGVSRTPAASLVVVLCVGAAQAKISHSGLLNKEAKEELNFCQYWWEAFCSSITAQ